MNSCRKLKACLPLLGALTWAAAGCQSEVSPTDAPASPVAVEAAPPVATPTDAAPAPVAEALKQDAAQAVGTLEDGAEKVINTVDKDVKQVAAPEALPAVPPQDGPLPVVGAVKEETQQVVGGLSQKVQQTKADLQNGVEQTAGTARKDLRELNGEVEALKKKAHGLRKKLSKESLDDLKSQGKETLFKELKKAEDDLKNAVGTKPE